MNQSLNDWNFLTTKIQTLEEYNMYEAIAKSIVWKLKLKF